MRYYLKNLFMILEPNYKNSIEIEIKQTKKKDMEEKGQCCDNRFEIIAKAKEALLNETNIARDETEMSVIDNILFRCWQMGWLDKYDDTKYSNSENIGNNLKPFNLEEAKTGKPVCTRDGRKVRIICFDREFIHKGKNYCIVALINDGSHGESLYSYTEDGLFSSNKIHNSDLMMLPEKKEGWVNVYKNQIHDILKSAEEGCKGITDYIKTIKVEWEE